jgi:hypothetical protein
MQAVGGTSDKPAYKELEGLVDAARKAKLEIFRVAQEATSLDREAVSCCDDDDDNQLLIKQQCFAPAMLC